MDAPAPPSRPRRDFLLLAAVVAAINLPYLGNGFLPGHDSKRVFGIFSYFYSHAVAGHELPRWMAFGTFGIKGAAFQFAALSPSSFLFLLGGALAGVRDTLTVFTLSLIGEQLIFLLGVHLLARRFFADRLTPLLIGFAAICGVVWCWQVWLNFRLVHLLPLEIFFLFRFAAERRPEFFWLSVLTLLLGGLGCPPSFYPLHALVFLALCLGLGRGFREAFPALAGRSWRNAAAFGLCVLAAGAIALTLHHALDGIRMPPPWQDARTARAPGTSLVAGFLGELPEFGLGVDRELTHFIGLLPLAGLPVALLRCRNPQFRSLLVAAVIVPLFALVLRFDAGGAMSLTRILLLLASGFGVDALLSSVTAGLAWDRRTRFGALGVLVFVLWWILDVQLGGERLVALRSSFSLWGFQSGAVKASMAVGLRLLAYLAAGAIVLWPSRSLPPAGAFTPLSGRMALLAALVLDGLLFQAIVISRVPRTPDALAFAADGLPYPERRGDARDAALEDRLRQWISAGSGGAEHHLAICSAFRIDPATALGRDDGSSGPVGELKEAREKIAPDPLLTSILGITAPKLRVFSSAVYADTPADALRLLSSPDLSKSQVVLEGVAPERRFTRTDSGEPRAAIQVKEFSANHVVLQVDLADDGPVWLSYADSFHPGWSATVNGKPEAVAKSFHAFKALRLDRAVSEVRFEFHDGIHTWAARLLALLATAFAAAGAAAFALQFRGAAEV